MHGGDVGCIMHGAQAMFQIREEQEPPQPKDDDAVERSVAADEDAPIAPRATRKKKPQTSVVLLHCDIIGSAFWDTRPWLLE